ncbi:beta-N-acetylhexosaminidase [Evansella vedderi]|uniref:Beta-N-acetylhexosaminidase n=1 Tax=Evansella vedderi TaxID=38282 RepID=A0ABU0A0U9_9BACI|nr:beta-N-acetylhexosaminidase [Evansella vedderi]MDQ0256647.1 beta-N-acetylhexosaminidase [Evansella vedderi]
MDTQKLRKEIGQMMVFGFKGDHPANISKEMEELIVNHHVGGIILFGRNIGTPEEILTLTTKLQKLAKESGHEKPLLICIDQENGVVRRLGEGTTVFPGAMLLGATRNPENAYVTGVATGKELKALGINWNLAPIVDVNNNPENPVIGVRSFGENPDMVAQFGKASMKGMQEAGIITALKHFPGHGDTNVDSHLALPTIKHSMERLEEVELVPFRACIEEGADVVMTSHVYFPAIEEREGVPATLSHGVITGLLREKLGYDGVITTDCMEMNAIADTVGTANGAVEAVKAGVDLVMISHMPNLQHDAIEAIVQAVEGGGLDEQRVHESAQRINKLKDRYLSWDDLDLDQISVPELVGCEEHRKEALDIIAQGITIVENNGNTLPLSSTSDHRVLVVYPENTYLTMAEDKRYSSHALGQVVQEIHPEAELGLLKEDPEVLSRILEKGKSFDTIIVGTISASGSKWQQSFIQDLTQLGKKLVVVAMRSPYDSMHLPKLDAYVCSYEFTTPALRVAAQAIYGKKQVTGKLPVTIRNK